MRAWRRPVTRPAASCLLPSGELAVRLFVAGLELNEATSAAEATPLWVWLALALIACGTAAYATGYFMIDELLGFRK